MWSIPRKQRRGRGPGRTRPRSRTRARPVALQHSRLDETPAQTSAGTPRGGLTRRAVALGAVVLLLLMSYGSSLRIWFETKQANAANREAITQSEERITALNDELARWDNPDHVRAQARERLGWVTPGEIAYRVLGPAGEPVGRHLDRPGEDPAAPVPLAWWENVWDSVQAVDEPKHNPTKPSTASREPLTDGTHTPTPSPSPTPSPTSSATPTARPTPTPTSTARPR